MTRRRWSGLGGALAIVAAGIVVVVQRSTRDVHANDGPGVPTGRVERGALQIQVHMDGDMRASRQQTVMAPTVGGTLRILKLAEAGSDVAAGDVILEFDPADQLYALEQAQSELLEAEQEIIQRRASNDAQEAQDKVSVLTEQFNVRRAELDAVVDKDLIAGNDYQIRQAQLIEARRTLAQTERDVQTRAAMSKAGLAVLEEKRAKANMAAERAKQNIESLVIKSPIDGVLAVRDNTDAAGGFFFTGMTMPQYRVGDTANPGRPMLDVFDVSTMEIRASVNEQERVNVSPGQTVSVDSSVAPGVVLKGSVTAVAGLGRPDRNDGPLRTFEVTLALEHADPRLRPGTSVDVVVQGPKVDGVLLLPRQAVFEKDGKQIVYTRASAGFQPVTVKVLHRSESRVAIEGVDEGAEVALVNPESSGGAKAASPTAAGTGLTK